MPCLRDWSMVSAIDLGLSKGKEDQSHPPATICAHDLAKGDAVSASVRPGSPSRGVATPVSLDGGSERDVGRSARWRAPEGDSYAMGDSAEPTRRDRSQSDPDGWIATSSRERI